MNSYHTFKNISPSVYQEIKDFIRLKHEIQVLEKSSHGLKESFVISSEFIKAHYYTKGKLLFQSSPTNKAYAKLILELDTNFSLNTLDEIRQKPGAITSDVKFFVGCDESGAGETFGSMFLGCVIVEAENMKNLERILDTNDIKGLNEYEILEKYNKIKKYCEVSKIKCGASEIDETSKNTLLDQKYEELLSGVISGKEKLCVIIDDYGIKRGLKLFLENLKSGGNVVVVEHKADEKYTACQAASVVARKERFEEIQNLNKEFNVQSKSGKTFYPGSGNAANPKTAEYLEAFMKLYPSKDLPPFVRRKWSNVQKLLQKKHSKKISRFFED